MYTGGKKLNWEEIRENNKKVPVKYDRDKLFDGLSAFVRDYAEKNGYDAVVSGKVIFENGDSFDVDIAVGKFEQAEDAFKGTPMFVIEVQPADVIYEMDQLKFKSMGVNGVREYWLFNSHMDCFETYRLDKEITEAGRLYEKTQNYAMGSTVCPEPFWNDIAPIEICPADFI